MRYVWHVSSASRRIIEARIDLRGRTRPIIASTRYRMSLIEKKTWTIRSCSFSSENDVKNVKYIITESEDHLHEHENNFSFFLFSKRNIINIFGNQSNIIKISTLFAHTHTHTRIYTYLFWDIINSFHILRIHFSITFSYLHSGERNDKQVSIRWITQVHTSIANQWVLL